MKSDRLYDLFNLMLNQTCDLTEKAHEFIRRVAATYAVEIQAEGEIPGQFMDDVLTDLEAEILEMYRKKTYGFFSLQEYRESRQSEPSSR